MTVFAARIGSLPGRVAGRLDHLADRTFAIVTFLPGGLLVGLVLIPPILAVLGVSFLRIELLKDDNIFFAGLRNYFRAARRTRHSSRRSRARSCSHSRRPC